MSKDILFLLQGDFMRGLEGPFYCPDCIALEGLLAYFPRLRDELDVVHLQFERPRPAIVEVLGEDHQDSPSLVLADPAKAKEWDLPVKEANGRHFMDDEKSILMYLSLAYGVSRSPR
ncbi:DUF3088 family protein [Pseudodesulfovibrio sp. zrk46]|uniref:DUF3088 family protein n=1 Tax=Pseudodesulfovibrio sp. zrk46 TaxID=2725288 RepID=UPI001449BA4C|nr:DUF3088 family protein [Pseudodesulfovibrio sp. zrk46]QJB56912.1 DUF3088 domain-containing protein [Pseudodesulfovibrio sp. zrk46]